MSESMCTAYAVRLQFARDAQGEDVPAFAVLHLPASAEYAEADLYEPRRPNEPGPAFANRAVAMVRAEAERRALPTWYELRVTYTSVIPPLWQRQRQATRHLFRWWAARGGDEPEVRDWVARKIAAIEGWPVLAPQRPLW